MRQIVEMSFRSLDTAIPVHVPYNAATGQVYLNGIGESLKSAQFPFQSGSIEMTEEEATHLRFVEADLHLGHDGNGTLFPVIVPIEKRMKKPVLSAVGSDEIEAAANLAFINLDADDYILITGGLQMPDSPP